MSSEWAVLSGGWAHLSRWGCHVDGAKGSQVRQGAMKVLGQKVEACVVVSQQQVCCVGMWSLWVGLLIDAWMGLGGQECLSAVPRVGGHEGAD